MEYAQTSRLASACNAGIAAATVFLLLAICGPSAGRAESEPTDHEAGSSEPVEIPPGPGQIEEFMGCELPDGSVERHPVTSAEMPWRVAIALPKPSPKYGSRQQARDAAIAAMQQWATSIRTRVPWFELAFVESDDDAPIQIEWKRRMLGGAAGRAGPSCRTEGASVRAGGQMEIAVQGCPTCRPLTVDEIKALVAHEFGHILGLGQVSIAIQR